MKTEYSEQHTTLTAVLTVLIISLELLDSSAMNMILPVLSVRFGNPINEIHWVVTSYLLGMAITTPLSGWSGARWGMRTTILSGITLFLFASVLCALSSSLLSLSVYRFLQGACGGILTPACLALLYNVFGEKKRVRASVIFSVPASLAPAIGPALGGWINNAGDWPVIFWLSAGMATVAALLTLRVVNADAGRKIVTPDYLSLFSASGSIFLFILLLSYASYVTAFSTAAAALLSLLLMRYFIYRSLFLIKSGRQPLLMIGLFSHNTFRYTAIIMFLTSLAVSINMIVIPFVLENSRHSPSPWTGAIMSLHAVGIVVGTLVAGKLASRWGEKKLLSVGLFGMGCLTFMLSAEAGAAQNSALAVIFLTSGIAFGFTVVPLQVLPFQSLSSAEIPHAATLISVLRLLGMTGGASLGAAGIGLPLSLSSVTLCMLMIALAGGIMLTGLCVSRYLPGKRSLVHRQNAQNTHCEKASSPDKCYGLSATNSCCLNCPLNQY